MGQAYHQLDTDGFRKQFAAIANARADSGDDPAARLAEYDLNGAEPIWVY